MAAACYLLGGEHRADGQTRAALGIASLSRLEVSEMPKDLDAQGATFRNPLEAHGGSIVARSAPGHGTTMTVELPADR